MSKPLDYFGRRISKDDLILYPGISSGEFNHAIVIKVYKKEERYRLHVCKYTDPNNIRTVHLSHLDKCVILDRDNIDEDYYTKEEE